MSHFSRLETTCIAHIVLNIHVSKFAKLIGRVCWSGQGRVPITTKLGKCGSMLELRSFLRVWAYDIQAIPGSSASRPCLIFCEFFNFAVAVVEWIASLSTSIRRWISDVVMLSRILTSNFRGLRALGLCSNMSPLTNHGRHLFLSMSVLIKWCIWDRRTVKGFKGFL